MYTSGTGDGFQTRIVGKDFERNSDVGTQYIGPRLRNQGPNR